VGGLLRHLRQNEPLVDSTTPCTNRMERKGKTIMGKRLTARNTFGVVYVGKHRKTPDMDVAGGLKVAACREIMDRLAEYEDLGLTPEQIKENLPLLSGAK
jgi:hypothetical protein